MRLHVVPIAKTIVGALLHCFDSAVLCMTRRPSPPTQEPRSVLLVRLDAIGDFVLWCASARQIRDHYNRRGLHVVLLGNAAWSELAQGLDLADEVWELDPKRFVTNLRYRAAWLRRLRGASFAVAVQPVFSRNMLTGDAVVRATNAHQRIGSTGDTANSAAWLKALSDRWYTQLLESAPGLRMELRRHAEFTSALTSTCQAALAPCLPRTMLAPLAELGQPYAVLFVGASWSGRVWPAEHFTEVSRRLTARGLRIVVSGGPADMQYAAPILRSMGASVQDLVGKTSLAELVELLRAARLVVTNETSAMHLAAAVGTAVVSIVGGGHFGRFAPYEVDQLEHGRRLPRIVSHRMPCFECNWKCKYPRSHGGAVRCIASVTVEQVWTEIDAALGSQC